MIKIIDNFLPWHEREMIYYQCLNAPFSFKQSGSETSSIKGGRFSSHFDPEDTRGYFIIDKVQKELDALSEHEYCIAKMYVNLYTPFTPTCIHDDVSVTMSKESPKMEDYLTAIYFANVEWLPQYGGELLFYNEDAREVIQGVTNVPSRLVIFDSRIPHCPKAPNVESPHPRINITFKTFRKTHD